MAENGSLEECITRHLYYPDIAPEMGAKHQAGRYAAMAEMLGDARTLLDVGCNTGPFSTFLDLSKYIYSGIDVSPDLVAVAKSNDLDVRVGMAESLPWGNSTFDAVVLGEILEHVHSPVQVLREAIRVARKRVVGSTPTENSPWGTATVSRHPYHVRCFTREELKVLLWNFFDEFMLQTTRDDYFYVFSLEVVK